MCFFYGRIASLFEMYSPFASVLRFLINSSGSGVFLGAILNFESASKRKLTGGLKLLNHIYGAK